MNTEHVIYIFTDAATSPQAEIAVGAFICLDKKSIDLLFVNQDLESQLTAKISYQQFKSKKSTWSEIQTLLHALKSIHDIPAQTKIEIYTDCQTLCDLLGKRKAKLQSNNYLTRSGKPFPHAKLYQELHAIINDYQINIYKIKGHAAQSKRLTWQEQVFAIIDKLSRRKLRLLVKNVD